MLVSIFLLTAISLFPSPFSMILVDDPVLEDIRLLSLESGVPFLSFSPPLAPGEIKNFLDAISEKELSPGATEAHHRVQKALFPSSNISYSDGLVSALVDINSTLEGRTSFNSDISWFPRYPKITPLISIPISLSFANTIQVYIEPVFALNINAYDNDIFAVNIPFEYEKLNHDLLTRAFAAIGRDWWSFQIGLDRLFWGTSHTGSLTFSDNSPYFDFARLSIFSSTIKYSLMVNQMPLGLTERLFTNPGESSYPSGWNEIDNLQHVLQRYFYLHRLDFKLFNRVSIGLMEGMIVGNSPLELRYLNPIIIFHSLFAWNDFSKWPPNNGDMIGSFASIELNWNIMNNLAVYGQVVMNEFSLPGESDEHPNALGYLAGIQFTHPFNIWSTISYLEFIYTNPYLSILSTPFASFIQMDRLGNYYFIGYPRDTIALSLGSNFSGRNNLNFSGRFSWISSGQHNDNTATNGLTWDWEKGSEAMGKRTPTGTAENKFVLSLGAGWNPIQWLNLNANLTGIVSLNNNHVSGDNQSGIQASFSVGFRY